MKLYLVRHASAADTAPSDAQRPLTRYGRDEARQLGVALAGMNIQPERILASPLVRAGQTAGILREELKITDPVEIFTPLANGHSTESLLEALPAATGDLLLVGHMPSLPQHVANITGVGTMEDYPFANCSIACVETGRLHWLKHLSEFRLDRPTA